MGNLEKSFSKASICARLHRSTTCRCLASKNKSENKNNHGGSRWGAARLSVGQVHLLHAWMALRAAWGGASLKSCTASLSAVAFGDAHLEERSGTVMWPQGAGCPLVAQNGNLNDVSRILPAPVSWGTGRCTSCTALLEHKSCRQPPNQPGRNSHQGSFIDEKKRSDRRTKQWD